MTRSAALRFRHILTRTALVLAGAIIFCGVHQTVTVRAAEHESPPSKAAPSNDTRVQATSTVSSAMREIRVILRNNHSLITHRRLGVSQAHAMAGRIKAEIAKIRASKLAKKLNDMLFPILSNLETGVDAIATPTEKVSRIDALFQIDKALGDYEASVDDPEWRPLRTQ